MQNIVDIAQIVLLVVHYRAAALDKSPQFTRNPLYNLKTAVKRQKICKNFLMNSSMVYGQVYLYSTECESAAKHAQWAVKVGIVCNCCWPVHIRNLFDATQESSDM